MADLFDALADPTRRELLDALGTRGEEMSVGELVERLGITQPTVSKHLKVLREHGLVQVREDGQHRYYRIAPESLGTIIQWLEALTPGTAGSSVDPTPELAPVDLWPAGYQIGSAVGQLRRQIDGLLGRLS